LRYGAILEADESGVIGSDPKASLRIFDHTPDPDGVENAFRTGDGREPHTVKAYQPGVRSKPKIAVAGLTEGVDLHIREALLGLPGAVEVLCEFAMGIEGGKAAWAERCCQKKNSRATRPAARLEHVAR
jgi:hypothetical protein